LRVPVELHPYYSPLVGAGLDDAKTTHGAARQAISAFFARHKAPTSARQKTKHYHHHAYHSHFLTATRLMTAWSQKMLLDGEERREEAERVRQTKSPSIGKQTLSAASMHWRGSPKQGWQQDTSTSNSCSILGSERRGKEGSVVFCGREEMWKNAVKVGVGLSQATS
jgi:hypothetical protein